MSLFWLVIEKVIEQVIWVVILDLAINQHNAFVHLAQNIVGRGGPHFDEPLFQKKPPYFVNGRIFQHKRFVGNFVAYCAVWQQDAYRRTVFVFTNVIRSANEFIGFGFWDLNCLLAVCSFIESGANAVNGVIGFGFFLDVGCFYGFVHRGAVGGKRPVFQATVFGRLTNGQWCLNNGLWE